MMKKYQDRDWKGNENVSKYWKDVKSNSFGKFFLSRIVLHLEVTLKFIEVQLVSIDPDLILKGLKSNLLNVHVNQ